MNKIKVKGYTRLVYNSKKQKIQPKKGLRIKKTTVALFALLTAISVVALQFRGLISDISPSESVQVPRVTNSQVSVEQVKEVANIKPDALLKFRPKTQHTSSEFDAYKAVIEACKHHGLDNENCRLDLMGIIYRETGDFTNKIGDGGKSYGVFQIHLGYHKHITVEQANDIYFATKWTLARMIHNGYKNDRDRAIRMHNGSPTNPKTYAYLQTVNSYINK